MLNICECALPFLTSDDSSHSLYRENRTEGLYLWHNKSDKWTSDGYAWWWHPHNIGRENSWWTHSMHYILLQTFNKIVWISYTQYQNLMELCIVYLQYNALASYQPPSSSSPDPVHVAAFVVSILHVIAHFCKQGFSNLIMYGLLIVENISQCIYIIYIYIYMKRKK